MEHTHLVKGLDFALLNKVRSEIKKPDAEDGKDAKARYLPNFVLALQQLIVAFPYTLL